MKQVLLSKTKAVAGCLFITFALTSCNQTNKADNEAAAQDSIIAAQKEAEAKAKAEALAKDSIEYTHFTSPDLSTFFLHGRVKTMTETKDEQKRTFHFNPDGQLVKHNGQYDEPEANEIFREKNRISGIGESQWGSMDVFEYEYDNNDICNLYKTTNLHGHTSYTFLSYDDYGWPASAKIEGEYHYAGTFLEISGSVSYKYTATDEYGNWTKCIESGKRNKTSILQRYDDETEEVTEDETSETEKISSTTIRRMVYYPREEVGL